MAVTRKYPREVGEYPEIMSKLDPLIIRVSPTVLLVGSTTYTAKVKMGSMFNGYYIHVSSVGLPILKQEVDISGQSNTNGTGNKGENSDAWNYITDMARDWLDVLEQSMLSNNSGKNIVDLLREIKFQNHFDLSGHTDMIEPYKDSVEVCTEGHTYPQDMLAQLITLNQNLEQLYEAINGDNGLNKRISDIEDKVNKNSESIDSLSEKLDSKLSTISDSIIKIGDTISTAVENGLDSLVGQMNVMNANITEVDSNVTGVRGVADNISKSVGEPNTPSGTPWSIRDLLNTWQSNYIPYISNIRTTVTNIRDIDVPDIKQAISSSSSSGAVGDVATTLSSLDWYLRNDLGYYITNTLGNPLVGTYGVLKWDDYKGWTIETELTKDNLIEDGRVKAVV